ncbi:hypothetical protein ACPV3U_16815 [Vibrio rotiferianus]|uniref:hypothetical protein n=1 Tax=Vibrio rotiferianus TaxID=190895 RepID=UPI00406AA16A
MLNTVQQGVVCSLLVGIVGCSSFGYPDNGTIRQKAIETISNNFSTESVIPKLVQYY